MTSALWQCSLPIHVRQCFPRWQVAENSRRVGRGATSNNEFAVKADVPRIAFREDGVAEVRLVVTPGSRGLEGVRAVKCQLVETSRCKARPDAAVSVPVGDAFYHQATTSVKPTLHKPYQTLDTFTIPDKPTPITLTLELPLSTAHPDVQTPHHTLDHHLLIQIEHAVAPERPRMVFDGVWDVMIPRRQFNLPFLPALTGSVTAQNRPLTVPASTPDPSLPTYMSTQQPAAGPLRDGMLVHTGTVRSTRSSNSSSSTLFDHPVAGEECIRTATLTVPIRIAHAAEDHDAAMMAIAPLPGVMDPSSGRGGGDDRRGSKAWASDAASVVSFVMDVMEGRHDAVSVASVARSSRPAASVRPPSTLTAHMLAAPPSQDPSARRISPVPSTLLLDVNPFMPSPPPSPLPPGGVPNDEPVEQGVLHEPVETPRVVLRPRAPSGSRSDELDLRAGDHVVVGEEEDGWVCGMNLMTGKCGVWPVGEVDFAPKEQDADDIGLGIVS
ncbi:hypothetical protein HK101_000987 [Irineochytrium annulatum]|nr:hypothetical protein HK101_000987 [Irineochytrium annulatum]